MKRKLAAPFLIVALTLASLGCAKKAVAPVPGQLNTFDAYAFRVLADTQAAINDFKASIVANKIQETPTLKMVLNNAILDYNAANMAYQAWHAAGGNGDVAPVANAISKVQGDVASIPAQVGVK